MRGECARRERSSTLLWMAQSMHLQQLMRSGGNSAQSRTGVPPAHARDDARPARLRHALDVLVASDPGLTRWRAGARAALTVIAASAALVPLAHSRHESGTLVLAGIVVGIMAAARVYDDTLRGQRITMLLAIPVTLLVIGAGSLAASRLRLDELLFCFVVFCATFARRYGPRGSLLGSLAFMSFFFSLFAHAGESDFVLSSLSIVIGVAIAYIVRFVIVRDRPERLLDGMLGAFRARAATILESLARMADATRDGRWRSHRLRVSLAHLNDAALALEDEAEVRRHRSAAADQWALDIFDVELAVETVADGVASARRSGAPARDLGGIARSARALGARVRAADGTGSDVPVEPDALPTRLERKMRFAADVLAHRQPWTPPRPADAVIGEAVTAAGGATPLGLNPDEAIPSREALRPTLRLAIQAAIAAALAMVAGHPLSSERWYWAVIGAFVVFLRATNRAESLSRAWQRILGTVGGVALGVVIADAVGADRRAALVLLYLSVFGAFYLAPLSYAWMIVFVTTALALLYDTLGNYSAALLSLRLEETLIGASIGAVVASVVLPAPARLSVDQRAADLLRESSRAVEALTAADASSLSPRARLRLARRVDRAAQRFRQATRPVWEINLPLHVPRFMHSARAAVDLAYAVRHLVARSGAAAREDAPVRAAPASEWLERISGARAKLAAAAGLPAPLAPTPPHAEIS